MSVEQENLNTFTKRWFLPECAWAIPNINELPTDNPDELKKLINKAILGLRPKMEKYAPAVKAFTVNAEQVVSAQLDTIALTYGYIPENQTSAVNARQKETLQEYKENQSTLLDLNKNFGLRAAAGVFLNTDDQTRSYGKNLLSIMNLLKAKENAQQVGNVKCNVIKFSMSMANELKRPEYEKVAVKLEKDLFPIYQNLETALVKIPGGLLGDDSLQTLIQQEQNALPEHDHTIIQLIQRFDVCLDIYKRANTVAAQKLAGLVLPIEKEHGTIAIEPTHKSNDFI